MTLATKFRDNKAVHAAAGAGDLAIEKLRELPETVTKLRETATKYQGEVRGYVANAREALGETRGDVRGTVTKYQGEARDTVAKYQGELKENVTKLRERMESADLPGAAVSYVAHAGARVGELIDDLAERGKKVVNPEAAIQEIEAGAKETARTAKAAASETKKTAQAAAKRSVAAAKNKPTP